MGIGWAREHSPAEDSVRWLGKLSELKFQRDLNDSGGFSLYCIRQGCH